MGNRRDRHKQKRTGSRLLLASSILALAWMPAAGEGTACPRSQGTSREEHPFVLPPSAAVIAGVLTPSHSPPAYARWGRLAVERTREKYAAGIADYRYEGHFERGGELEEYRFKLVLQPRPGLPAAVRVSVTVAGGVLAGVKWEETGL
ncbi:DUF3889 domain-containing protein [Paenibacillus sp. P22]|uniref:DUF3889 domain-containing protein n=1 Tax=Paenibacillus sp. P22 TaxID=483908 RepID=UPI00038F9550|nr:DUF3889 domain-containing protein [Paenibacillus sp. P22]CDN46111.1 hypothetical protein BN871_KQ_00020 [Paenibacillus sp. P22]